MAFLTIPKNSLLDMIPIARKLIIMVDQLAFFVNMEDPSRFLVPPDDLTTLPNENNSLNADNIEKAKNINLAGTRTYNRFKS